MNKALLEYEIKRRGLSTAQVAEHIGINRATFSQKCNGHSEFKLSEIVAIIQYLGIDDPVPIFFADQVS